MGRIKSTLKQFSKTDIILWSCSVILIITSFCIFDRESCINLVASLIGVTSLIFCAKGNPIGQVLMIIFSMLYGIISYSFSYYGEMMTYLGMTMPMSAFALVSWLKNPYNGNKSEVKVAKFKWCDIPPLALITVIVTVVFYFVLDCFNTANLIPSTVSVTTSFIAVYLTYKRSVYFTLAYAANDVVLIALWIFASVEDSTYISVVICFVVFLINDLYGFINWRRMEKRQQVKPM